MTTLLTTRRMAPELRARVEASISGRRRTAKLRLAPRWIALLRAVTLTAILVCVGWMVLRRHQGDQEVERARADLLVQWQGEASRLSADELALVSRVAPWVQRAAGKYEGDRVADELASAQGLAAVLKRPLVYVRGSLHDLSRREGLEAAARDSANDALLLCLLAPPEMRTEKALLRRVRSASSSGAQMRKATGHVQPLGAAVVALPLLDPAWRERIVTADDLRALDHLRRVLRLAPLESARQAAQARLLLVAVDEPGERAAPAELDGERPHHIRLQLVDLQTKQPLLRLRRRVSPAWLSDSTRAAQARGVDGCTFAFDVRQELAAGAKGNGR